jgi:hypothetical protein
MADILAEQESRQLYSPNAKEQKTLEQVLQFKEQCYRQTATERLAWRESLERYNLKRLLSEYDYIDDLPTGLTYDAVERAVDHLPGREFGLIARPQGSEDTHNALLFAEVLKQDWNSPDQMDGPTKMEIVKRGMRLFGTSITQVYWETITDEQGNVVKSGPAFQPLNIFDFYINKFVPDVDEADYIGYLSTVSLEWFQTHAKDLGFKNIKYVNGVSGNKSQGIDSDSSTLDKEDTPQDAGLEKLRLVKLFEVQSNNRIITVALDEQPVVLRDVPNRLGRKNCVVFRWKRHPFPNRFYGVSDVAKAGPLEDAIQRQLNQAVFNTLLVDNAMFTYDKTDRNIDTRTFVAAPSAAIPRGQNPNSIVSLKVQSHLSESLTMIGNLMDRYKRLVNIPDIMAAAGQANTATQDNLNDINARTSIDKVVDGMKGSFLHLWSLLRDLYTVYGPDSITVSLYAPDLLKQLSGVQATPGQQFDIPKDQFSLKRDLEVTVDQTTMNRAVMLRRLNEALAILKTDPSIPANVRLATYGEYFKYSGLDKISDAFQEAAGRTATQETTSAESENQAMFGGQQLPPTPNATPAHTQVHVDFMRSTQTGPEVDRLLQAHIEGELQQGQTQGQMAPPQESAMPAEGNMATTEVPNQL